MPRPSLLSRTLLVSAIVLGAGSASAQEPYRHHRHPLPPEVAYRDPSYAPPPPVFRAAASPHRRNVPLYNEPPRRFPQF